MVCRQGRVRYSRHRRSEQTVDRLDGDETGTTSIRTTAGPRELLTVNESGVYSLVFTSRKPEAKRFRKWVTARSCRKFARPALPASGGHIGLSGERVDYERWLLERALIEAQIIAIEMRRVGVHFEQMTDDPEFGAARADTNFADYHRELRENVHRSRGIHEARPTRLRLQPRPETCRTLETNRRVPTVA